MRSYSVVRPSSWTNALGRAIRAAGPHALVVRFYLETGPAATMTGIYYLSIPSLAFDTGLTDREARAALAALERVGFAVYDDASSIVWVPSMAATQIGTTLKPSDKRRDAIFRDLEAVKESRFIDAFWVRYAGPYDLPTIAPWREFRRGIEGASKDLLRSSVGASIHEQEQEHEQEHEQEQETFGASGADALAKIAKAPPAGTTTATAATTSTETATAPATEPAAPPESVAVLASVAVSVRDGKLVPPPGWNREACDDWIIRFGGTAPGARITQALRPLAEKYTWPAVRAVWQKYLEAKDAEYASAEDFAQRFGVWRDGKRAGKKSLLEDPNVRAFFEGGLKPRPPRIHPSDKEPK